MSDMNLRTGGNYLEHTSYDLGKHAYLFKCFGSFQTPATGMCEHFSEQQNLEILIKMYS